MLPIEDAYARYRAGEISYEEYRRLHADPDDQVRLARVRTIKPERPQTSPLTKVLKQSTRG